MTACGRLRKFKSPTIEQIKVRYTSEADVKLTLVKRSVGEADIPGKFLPKNLNWDTHHAQRYGWPASI